MVAALTMVLGGAGAPAQARPTSVGAASGALPNAGRRSEVRYAEGLLTVAANNASLNGLLREIAQRTGMRVSGTVREDRVFGTYGPADPSRVLSLLLDGTGSNVLLVQAPDDRPRELILTTRVGGATPPDPNAAAQAADDDEANGNLDDNGAAPNPITRRGGPSRGMLPTNAPGYRPPVSVASPAANAEGSVGGVDRNPAAANGSPSSTEQPVVLPAIDATTPPATASSTPADNVDSTPKDAKSPQQIFEELQRLRQQQGQSGSEPQP